MKSEIKASAFWVAGLYAAISTAWVLFSDRLIASFALDYARLTWFQTIKGLLFVAVTAAFLFFFSKRQFEAIVATQANQDRVVAAALLEKEALLREIHHRVKNNLQVIISLLSLRGEKEERFVDIQEKVRSMALAHDLLSKSADLSSIDAGNFATSLAESFDRAFGSRLFKISGEGDRRIISADTAVAIGIFVAEACSNASKFALKPETATTVRISIGGCPDGIKATVRDDGPGFPDPGAASGTALGFGAVLMDALAAQALGYVSRRNDGGAVVELTLPCQPRQRPKAR